MTELEKGLAILNELAIGMRNDKAFSGNAETRHRADEYAAVIVRTIGVVRELCTKPVLAETHARMH
jgi:hypothetical protein